MTHLKRHAAPLTYPIPRKSIKFATTIKGGGHKHKEAIPLRVVLRDVLGYARNMRESKKIVSSGKVMVDQVVRREDRFGVGLMDAISIIPSKKHFRLLPKKGRLVLVEIPEREAKLKLCRIEDKSVLKGGNIQLNLHDGRNILVKVKNPENPKEDVYKTKDSLLISLPEQKIIKHIKLEEGKLGLVIKGKLAGKVGRIKKVEKIQGLEPNRAVLEIDDQEVETLMDYVFVVGDENSEITLG